MTRGELYLVKKPGKQDPRRQRVFVIVSRQLLLETSFSVGHLQRPFIRGMSD